MADLATVAAYQFVLYSFVELLFLGLTGLNKIVYFLRTFFAFSQSYKDKIKRVE